MDWFSKNFPSLANLVSILGKTTQRRPKPRTRGPARRVATPTIDGSREAAEIGTLDLDQTPQSVTEEADQVAPVLTEESSFDASPSEIEEDALEEDALLEGREEAESPAFVGGWGNQPPIVEELATKPSEPEKQPVSDTAETTRNTNMAQM